jgi:hypothetical protein
MAGTWRDDFPSCSGQQCLGAHERATDTPEQTFAACSPVRQLARACLEHPIVVGPAQARALRAIDLDVS